MSASTLSPAALCAMLRARANATPTTVERVCRGGKVLFYPCPDGTVKIVGVTDRGRWVGEWSCLEEDFNENMMLRMARHVMKKASKLALVG